VTAKVDPTGDMKWRPVPAELAQTFAIAVATLPEAESRRMFGYPAAFTHGQMFAGVFGEHMILRLPDADRAQFLCLEGARMFEPMPGRVWKEYVVVPAGILSSQAQTDAWLRKSHDYVRRLPAKSRSKRRGWQLEQP